VEIKVADVQELDSGGFQLAIRGAEILVVATVAVHPDRGILDPEILKESQIFIREGWANTMTRSKPICNRSEFSRPGEWGCSQRADRGLGKLSSIHMLSI
jgi:hypothetical protein